MLANSRLGAFIATSDSDRARAFYRDVLGLKLVIDDEFALGFDANGTSLRIQKVPIVQLAGYTTLGWDVADIGKAVATLAQSGVTFERYAAMQQDAAGIWTAPGGTRVAWFKDPDGNLLSLAQHAD